MKLIQIPMGDMITLKPIASHLNSLYLRPIINHNKYFKVAQERVHNTKKIEDNYLDTEENFASTKTEIKDRAY